MAQRGQVSSADDKTRAPEMGPLAVSTPLTLGMRRADNQHSHSRAYVGRHVARFNPPPG